MPKFVIHNPTKGKVQIPGTGIFVKPGANLTLDIQPMALATDGMQSLLSKGILRLSPVVETPSIHDGIEIPVVEMIPPPSPPPPATGITEAEHEALDTLTHEVAETSFTENAYTGSNITRSTVWTDVGMTLRIRESTFTYTGSRMTSAVFKQYDGAGAVLTTLTKTYAYTGSKLTGVTVVRS